MVEHKKGQNVAIQMREVTGREAIEAVEAGCLLVDVRTPAEFEESHAESAINIPLDRLSRQRIEEMCPDQEPIFLVCKSGSRARQGAKLLVDSGCQQVACVSGGVQELERAGAPMVRGRKAISLERQVRIAAGGLNLLGIALAVWVNPWFLLLSGFVGAGLVFAGVTDHCGMGLLLAKMPWNNRQNVSCANRNGQHKGANLAPGA